MRRTRSSHLHPAGKWKLAHVGAERFVADAPGVQRVESSGSGFWGYIPNDPDIDITMFHRQVDFDSVDDIDLINLWRESSLLRGGGGTGLSLVDVQNSVNGHAYAITPDGDDSFYQYQDRYFATPLALSQTQTWFICQIRTRAEVMSSSTAFFGWLVDGENFYAADSGYTGLWLYSDASTQTTALRFRSRRQPGYTYTSEQIDLEYDETVTLALKLHHGLYADNVTWFEVYVNDLSEPVLRGGISDSLVAQPSTLPTFAVGAAVLGGGRGFLYLNYIKSMFAKG